MRKLLSWPLKSSFLDEKVTNLFYHHQIPIHGIRI
jgi:hypothetical protein